MRSGKWGKCPTIALPRLADLCWSPCRLWIRENRSGNGGSGGQTCLISIRTKSLQAGAHRRTGGNQSWIVLCSGNCRSETTPARSSATDCTSSSSQPRGPCPRRSTFAAPPGVSSPSSYTELFLIPMLVRHSLGIQHPPEPVSLVPLHAHGVSHRAPHLPHYPLPCASPVPAGDRFTDAPRVHQPVELLPGDHSSADEAEA
jgi:hypothetical protein